MFIYGPPAVRRLEVAEELSKLTGYKLYHNNVSIQEVNTIPDFGTPTFWRLVGRSRKEMIRRAAKEGIDTIFTFVYAKNSDDKTVREIHRCVDPSGGNGLRFVRLHCDGVEL